MFVAVLIFSIMAGLGALDRVAVHDKGARRGGLGVAVTAEFDWEHVHFVGRARRTLVEDAERPDGLDVVAPELDADGLRRAEREEVDDAAPDRELAHLFDQGYTLEAPLLQRVDQRPEPERRAHRNRKAQFGDAVGHRAGRLR